MRALIALSVLLSPAAAAAADPAGATQRRWGIGWDSGYGDSGLALRRYLSENAGLAVRLNPNLSQSEYSRHFVRDTPDEDRTERDSDQRTYAIDVALFRERPWGSWFRGGPFVALGYEYYRFGENDHEMDQRSYGTVIADTHGGTLRRTVKAALGLRPVFKFHDRLLLETQFGLQVSLSRYRRDSWRRSATTPPEGGDPEVEFDSSRESNASLGLAVFGEELGPAAQLTFVVLF